MTKTGYAQHCNKSANYLHRAISVGGYLLVVARRSAARSALVVLALPPCPYLTSCRPFRDPANHWRRVSIQILLKSRSYSFEPDSSFLEKIL